MYAEYRPLDHQVDALESLESALATDLRFEHMKPREIKEAVEAFANTAFLHRNASHAAGFTESHAETPVAQTCFFPIEGLTVHRQVNLAGATLYPCEEVDPPEFIVELDPTMESVITAECSGTNGRAMMSRARTVADHALRLLRVALSQDTTIVDQQLRFRLGTTYWFTDSGGGFGPRAGEGVGLDLGEEALDRALAAPIATLPANGETGVQQSANRALEWLERAQLATEPLVELLFLFFALEGILGDASEGLKAEGLALRRAVLSHAQNSGYTHPGDAYWLYEKVRSAAVHGEDVPQVTDRRLGNFAADVRVAIGEFLEFADAHGFAKRGQVLRALDTDPVRIEIRDGFLSA